MKVGAERKQIAFLGALLVFLAAYLIYDNLGSGSSTPTPAGGRVNRATPAAVAPDVTRLRVPVRRAGDGRPAQNDLKYTMRRPKPGEGPAPEEIDPTLRTDLLAKVQQVPLGRAERSLFEFASAPVPLPPPVPKNQVPKILPGQQVGGVLPPSNTPALPPPTPTAPPIPLQFYGFVNNPRQAAKRAFFLDGEDILVAKEGEVVKRKYKLVRIGVNSVVMQDMDFKSDQTLPLMAEQMGQ